MLHNLVKLFTLFAYFNFLVFVYYRMFCEIAEILVEMRIKQLRRMT